MEIFNTIIIIVSFLAFIISSFIAPLVIIVIMFVCVFNSIKSYRIHRYFKDNVVKVVSNRLEEMSEASEKENIYVDVSKDKLETFNTTDIDSLKDFFYDIFWFSRFFSTFYIWHNAVCAKVITSLHDIYPCIVTARPFIRQNFINLALFKKF